jgi:hypothetical protein
MDKDNYSMIKSRRLCGFLLFKGFTLINSSPDKKDPNKTVYWFNNSNDLVESIHQYMDLKNKYGSIENIFEAIKLKL